MSQDGTIITPSVLIVEDKTIIRLCLIDAFSDAGFRVSEANDAEEAIDILQTEARCIDVIFTDVNMPGARNGMELVHYVRQHWPWIALLVTSGRVTPGAAELPPGSRFLPKPYDTLAAIEHVRELAQAA